MQLSSVSSDSDISTLISEIEKYSEYGILIKRDIVGNSINLTASEDKAFIDSELLLNLIYDNLTIKVSSNE
jgi:hypothetical protein